ncbi:polymorphic toxin type 50 domain-containing protein [Allofustis seminis]|uniref:polymorphic toxin type 50 domain-containing protein n=1 Tax=Allofustis seminis TaxID=166939 RepID=UPI00039D3F4F|nr:polymorphic toxin type 50 domain-containing protein [Allofustis seminis]
MKYNKLEQWIQLQDHYYVKSRLEDGRWTSVINPEKQAPHMESTAGSNKSYFYDGVNVQELFDKYAGTGTVIKRKSRRTWVEVVDVTDDRKIGVDIYTGKHANALSIHYSKKEHILFQPILKRRIKMDIRKYDGKKYLSCQERAFC